MRGMLEHAVGHKIKVAAILLTHWHYADGAAAWLDEGTEVWGREHLDRNRSASGGVNVLGGVLQSRAIAQFGVFHPTTGPDAFPNLMSFTPEKFLAVSSYQPPTRLFPDGRSLTSWSPASRSRWPRPARRDGQRCVLVPAAPNARDRLPCDRHHLQRLHSARRTYRDAQILVNDARWVESKNAETLLDIHRPALQGEKICGRRSSAPSIPCSSSTTRRCARWRAAMAFAELPSPCTCRAACARTARRTVRSRATSGRSTTEISAGRWRRIPDQSAVRPGRSRTHRAVDGRRRRRP